MTLTVVVPCHDEAARLRPEVFVAFLESHPEVSVVFVDDASRDSTGQVLAELASAAPSQVAVVSLGEHSGKAEAVRRGVLSVRRLPDAVVAYLDADLAGPLESVLQLRDALGVSGAQLAMGCRTPGPGRVIERRPLRRLGGLVYARAASAVIGEAVSDPQCGAKAFRVDGPVPDCFGAPFRSRWAFDVELLLRLRHRTGRRLLDGMVVEVPLREWREVADSRLRVADRVVTVWELVRLAWTRLTGTR